MYTVTLISRFNEMTTLIFDFDSTIISIESLEYLLSNKFSSQPALLAQIKKITEEGIRGKIPFETSLERRLTLGTPTKDETVAFGQAAGQWLTPGIKELFKHLHSLSIDLWIISGALVECIVPLGLELGVPKEQIHGVKAFWNPQGLFNGIDKTVPFCRSKVEGVKPLAKKWKPHTIAIGDAVSDYRLFEEGLVKEFIVFTEYFRCNEVLQKGVPEAKNVKELKKTIEQMIQHHAVTKKREN